MKQESLWLSRSPWTVVEVKENNVKRWLVENLNSSFWSRSSYSMLHFACPEWLLTSVFWLMICLQDDLVGLLPFGYKSDLKDLSSKKIHLFWATGQDFFEPWEVSEKSGPFFCSSVWQPLTKFCVANLFLDSILWTKLKVKQEVITVEDPSSVSN